MYIIYKFVAFTISRCAYGLWFHALNLMIYIMFLASLTGFIASYDPRYMEAGITGVMKGVDSPKNNVLNGSISTEPSTPEPIQHGILPHNAVEVGAIGPFNLLYNLEMNQIGKDNHVKVHCKISVVSRMGFTATEHISHVHQNVH